MSELDIQILDELHALSHDDQREVIQYMQHIAYVRNLSAQTRKEQALVEIRSALKEEMEEI